MWRQVEGGTGEQVSEKSSQVSMKSDRYKYLISQGVFPLSSVLSEHLTGPFNVFLSPGIRVTINHFSRLFLSTSY